VEKHRKSIRRKPGIADKAEVVFTSLEHFLFLGVMERKAGRVIDAADPLGGEFRQGFCGSFCDRHAGTFFCFDKLPYSTK